MPTLAAPLDCAKLETRNERVHQLTGPPASPVEGQLYYNTTDHTFYWFDGTIWQSAKGGAPGGAAGGDLTGTYPNPQIAALAVTDAKVAAANKDGTAGVPSMRTLGTGAQQAMAGNAAPNAHHATHDAGGSDPMVIDALAATGSLRTLGLTGNKAMPGIAGLDTISGATPATADITASGRKIVNLAVPISGTDAANKGYVDAAAQNLDVKASCRVASVLLTNINIASPGATIDGVTMAAGDRVLVSQNSSNTENGIYVWNGAAVAMTRALDADTGGAGGDVSAGMFTFITEGTTNADSGWILTTNDPIVLGTTGLVFTQFSGAGQVTAGAGLTKTGNQLDVGQGAGLQVNADTVQIANAGVTQAMLAPNSLRLDAGAGLVTNILPVANGGTNGNNATAARLQLGVPTWYSSAVHGAGTTITIPQSTHQIFASAAIFVQVQVEATGAVILPDIVVNPSTGNVTVTFAASQSANTIRVTLTGLQSSGSPTQPA